MLRNCFTDIKISVNGGYCFSVAEIKKKSGGENKGDILIVPTGSRPMGLAFSVNLVYLDISNTTSKMLA